MSNRGKFLHNHPGSERILGVDPGHVIVDKKDWETAMVNGKLLLIRSLEDALEATRATLRETQVALLDKTEELKAAQIKILNKIEEDNKALFPSVPNLKYYINKLRKHLQTNGSIE